MTLTLVSPLLGWAAPLEALPDAAFAERMVGDGIAIDPIGTTLHSPCAGTVIGLHRAGHAVTLRADNGAEILCHIGIETVALGGEGFTPLVSEGQRVEAGRALIRFNLDTLARGAKSLESPILIIDQEAFQVTRRTSNVRVAVGEWIMDVETIGVGRPVSQERSEDRLLIRNVTVPAGHGIHARPAAAIVSCARKFAAEIEIASTTKNASATSAVALMTLGLAEGDRAIIRARGAQAAEALEALGYLIENLRERPDLAPVRHEPSHPSNERRGVTAVPGLAVGTIVRSKVQSLEPPAESQGVEAERASFETAITAVRDALTERMASGSSAQREIARAHLELLDDPRLHTATSAAIADGCSAGSAWRNALAVDVAALRELGDARMAARAMDLVDLEQQVIAATLGIEVAAPVLPAEAILVAHDLLPSELMRLDQSRLAAIALAGGGPTSHVAIIASASGIPMVVAMGVDVMNLEEGTRAILDADAGTLFPSDETAETGARNRIEAASMNRADAEANAKALCSMADGKRIEIFANLGALADADTAVAAGAEGCGLLRTELLFLDRDTPPDEAEQFALYDAIAARLNERPLIIRTLDIGGDKPVRYLPIATEENPALGLRGIRVGLAHPDLLDPQLRAILRVARPGQCRILVPMVASVDELAEVRRRAEIAAREIGRSEPIEIGVMIETPAAAIAADLLAPLADFFAIGTNDLAQYTLAMDRSNAAVAPKIDGLHPAVLRMIDCAVRAAATYGRPVGVCGGLASDLTAAPILIGLGVTELSAVPIVIPQLKALVRTLTLASCNALAAMALQQLSATAVRALSVRTGS